MNLRYFLLLLLFGVGLQGWSQSYDTTAVLNRISAALENPEEDEASKELQASIFQAKQMKFRRGSLLAYRSLINLQQKSGSSIAEMGTRLQFINFLEKTELLDLLPDQHERVGDIYMEFQVWERAGIAFAEAKKTTVSTNKAAQFKLQKKLSVSQHRNKQYAIAEKNFNEAISLSRQLDESEDLLWLHQQKSALYHEQKEFDKEVAECKRILHLTDSLNMREAQAKALNNLGFAYKFTGNSEEASNYFQQVLDQEGHKPLIKAVIRQNQGIIFQNQKEYSKAQDAFLESARLHENGGDFKRASALYDVVATIFYQKGDPYNALIYNRKSLELARSKKFLDVEQAAYRTQSLIHQSLFEFEAALESYTKHLILKDSLELAEQKRKNDLVQNQEFLDRLERELNLLWIGEEIKDLQIAKLTAEKETEQERLVTLEKEAELKEAEAARTLQRLQLKQQKLELEQEKSEKLKLEAENELEVEQKRIIALKLDREKIIRIQQEEALTMQAQEKRILNLEKEEQIQRTRNLGYIAFGLLLFLLIILISFRQVRKKNKQIAKQNLVIADERNKSDQLLLNILPAAVAEELKEKGQSKPRHYDEVTVVFTDFSGFTRIAELLSPQELVSTLDKIFLEFDLIAEKYGLMRIKTIGDAYMAAAGLPEYDPDHAQKSVETALEMRDYITNFNSTLPEGQAKWNIRIGVNSGPVVAGVVGVKKFAYDIWGDAVNLASRMESSGQIGKVNISGQTKPLLNGKFDIEPRGKIMAKGKGEVDMFFAEWKS